MAEANAGGLAVIGWNETTAMAYQDALAGMPGNTDRAGLLPGRVLAELKHWYRVRTEEGILLCRLRGSRIQEADSRTGLPTVGDWVIAGKLAEAKRGVIEGVLERENCLVRRAIGNRIEEQVLGANLDYVLIVQGLDKDFNPRRLQRYLALVWESGINPVVLLNKADLASKSKLKKLLAETRTVLRSDVPLFAGAALQRESLQALERMLEAGSSWALLGASGCGKSTLINTLLGSEEQRVRPVRERDSRGRHTTTTREFFQLPGNALLMDTPGIREVQLWNLERGVEEVFADIVGLAEECRFRDCSHSNEPGCAVLEKLSAGELSPERLAHYHKLQEELFRTARLQQEKKWREGRQAQSEK